jgi:hypothetical protein
MELLADDEARFERALDALADGIEIVPDRPPRPGALVIERL